MKLDHSAPYIFTLDGVISDTECSRWIREIDSLDPELAPVQTINGEVYQSEYRNNERVIINSTEYAKSLFETLRTQLPSSIFGWHLSGLNEMLRCYRYKPGTKFLPHSDSHFSRSDNERSFYTLLLYLNEVELGGETAFFVEPEVVVPPKAGTVVVFQHDITHEGREVKAGIKYVIRSDVMYRRNDK